MAVAGALVVAVLAVVGAAAEPRQRTREVGDLERTLEDFLELYYEEHLEGLDGEKTTTEGSLLDRMLGDEPAEADEQRRGNISDYVRTMKNRPKRHVSQLDESILSRSKETWIQILKENILKQIGRGNNTISKSEGLANIPVNISQILPSILNSSNLLSDDQITEKIRSFYPSCDLPANTDQEVWKDDDVMNLYFNFDYPSDGRNTNIATATLRLYRLPQNGTKFNSKKADCDLPESNEDEKLLRVSIYWYTRSLKKSKKAKRRLSDSKVVQEGSRWVELSVRPAARAWTRGRNLGLAVLVEDQEGTALKADQYFKGASCMPPQSQYRRWSWTPSGSPTNLTEYIAYLEEAQRRPQLVTRGCSPP